MCFALDHHAVDWDKRHFRDSGHFCHQLMGCGLNLQMHSKLSIHTIAGCIFAIKTHRIMQRIPGVRALHRMTCCIGRWRIPQPTSTPSVCISCTLKISFSPKHRDGACIHPQTAVGRDSSGTEPDSESDVPRIVVSSDIFKLHGEKVLKGFYEVQCRYKWQYSVLNQ